MVMATRSTARKLQALINEAAVLELPAAVTQAEDETAAIRAAKDLAVAYRRWFNASLEVLPDDLRDRFRREYEGGFMSYKIKHFLESPRKKNPIYRDDLPETSKEIWSYWQFPFKDKFLDPLNQQLHYLEEALARCGVDSATAEALELLDQIARRMPITFSVLGKGNRNVPAIAISDEYDVQHILHAIAVLHFVEVEPEEPTPRMAGGYSRLDFLLRRERIAIETKMIRPGLSREKLRKELAEDIVYFRAHPNVSSLFILVYDPQRKITNSVGFESDLRSDSDDFVVRVAIVS